MIRLTTASAVACVAALLVAMRLGGSLGMGVIAGYTLGAGFSGLGVLYQRHTLRTAPERALQAFTISFLAKLVMLLLGALAFRFVDQAAARVDWRSFLVAYAASVALILPLGSLDLLHVLRQSSAGRSLSASGR